MNPGFQMDNEGSVCSMQDSVSDEDEMTVGDIKSFMGDSILADAGSESVWERDIRCLEEDIWKTGLPPGTQKCTWLTKERQRSQSLQELTKDESGNYSDFCYPALFSGGESIWPFAGRNREGTGVKHTFLCLRYLLFPLVSCPDFCS